MPVAAPFDEAAEARDLVAAERATRSRRDTAVQGLGSVPTKAKTVASKPVRTAAKPPRRSESAPAVPVQAAGSIAVVIAYAKRQIGKPYRWGSAGPDAFDCSGLIMMAFAQIGVRLPHQSGGIAARGRTVPRSQLRPGDTLHWSGHVALALGGNLMVHASRAGVPVKIATIYGNPRVVRIVG